MTTAEHARSIHDQNTAKGGVMALHPLTRALVQALGEALDIPIPARNQDWQARTHLLDQRVAEVLGCLDYLVNSGDPQLAICLESLGDLPARHPVSYTTRPGECSEAGS